MRLSETVVVERETFVKELFKTTPTLTVRQAQEKIKEKFVKQMRPGRILELKDMTLNPAEPVVTNTVETEKTGIDGVVALASETAQSM